MKEGYWVIRTYKAGDIGEKTKFWVPSERGVRSARREKSEIKKQEQNEYSAVKRLARLINANFGEGDLLLGLDYSPEGEQRLLAALREKGLDPDRADEGQRMEMIREAAEREMRLALRRVKRELGDGAALKYIGVTSDMDGDTGEAVRIHHHLIVPAEAKQAFAEKWRGLGSVDWEPLSKEHDYIRIADYLLRQVRRVPDAKKYVSSRNLIRPVPKDRAALSGSELRVPKGAVLLQRSEFRPGQAQYIRYILPEEEQRREPPGREKTA